MNHAVDDHSIIFRTDPGSKLRGIVRSPMVCFEVDAIDPATQRGWSVMVKGRATELAAADRDCSRESPAAEVLGPWREVALDQH